MPPLFLNMNKQCVTNTSVSLLLMAVSLRCSFMLIISTFWLSGPWSALPFYIQPFLPDPRNLSSSSPSSAHFFPDFWCQRCLAPAPSCPVFFWLHNRHCFLYFHHRSEGFSCFIAARFHPSTIKLWVAVRAKLIGFCFSWSFIHHLFNHLTFISQLSVIIPHNVHPNSIKIQAFNITWITSNNILASLCTQNLVGYFSPPSHYIAMTICVCVCVLFGRDYSLSYR